MISHDDVFIIAEAGKNFITKKDMTVLEAFDAARTLAAYAKESGAHAVKFQTHVFEDEQKKRSEARYEWIKFNEVLTPLDKFWIPLKEFCDGIGIKFMTTPMSALAAKKVSDLVSIWKIGSADIVDPEIMEYVVTTKKSVIMSTGMSTPEQIDRAYKTFAPNNTPVGLLHCVSLYPCPVSKLHLNMIPVYQNQYPEAVIGFSDHSLSTKAPAMAIKMGATIIEKHFTLDRYAYGPDHKCSLLPAEFKEMVHYIDDAALEVFAPGEYTDDRNLLSEEKDYWKNFRHGLS